MNKKSRLVLARRDRLLVKFTRPFEQGSVNGYVLDVGRRFFLMVVVEPCTSSAVDQSNLASSQ